MASKVGIVKGTRDFSPEVMVKRNYISETIAKHFKLSGFQQIETPSFEKIETLIGKYGEEGDRLIFKILNSGNYLKKVTEEELAKKNNSSITPKIVEKALRYDLTIPFARYVVKHQNEISLPFKRFQIQPVWRADRPQKGRYREFYQCDADVIGSDSLWQEVDLIHLYANVFTDLKIDASIKLNNRKILYAITQIGAIENQFTDFTVIIDKIDKIGLDRVLEELQTKFGKNKAIEIIQSFPFTGNNKEKIDYLSLLLNQNKIGTKGLEELQFLIEQTKELKNIEIDFDVTLARGLDYYTGAIFEVVAKNIQLGSIGGGGRYDDLTDVFGLKNMSGVGISFGLDRIYLVLEELDLFPDLSANQLKILFINFGEQEAAYAYNTIKKLRAANISSDLYPSAAKMKKQMKYANDICVPYVVLAGEEEIKSNLYKLKNMLNGEEQQVHLEKLIALI